MAIYVQLADKLLKVSGDVTAENITQALGYVPFSGEFSELKNSPFTEDESGEYNVVDEAGNIILKINQEGVKTTRVILPKGDVQSQIDGLDGRYSDITLELENLGTEIENIDFESLKNNPITITDGEFIIMDDNEPANIGLKLNTEGLFVRDVYIDGNSIKGQFEDINGQLVDVKQNISDLNTEVENIDFENLKNNPIEITEGEFVIMDDRDPSNIGLKLNSEGLFVKDVIIDGESVQTQINELAAQDVTIKGNIENITSEMDSMKTSFTTDNLTVNQKTIINGETTINGTTSVYGTTNVENLITDSIETDGTDLSFTDQSGNTVARIDNTGISAFEVSVVIDNEVAHRLSEKANQAYVEGEVAEIERTIADNEKVTSEALTSLDNRMDAAESGITSLNNTKADKNEVNTQISGVTQNLENHIATKATGVVSGHVTLDSGDSSTNAYVDGVAAASKHSHSQYVENTGDTITGNLTVTGTVEMGDLTLRKDEFIFTDEDGNKIAEINADGVSSTEFTSGAHKLTAKANQSDLESHAATKATSGVSGHVMLKSGDFKSITAVTEGVAASPAHTHSQYSETGHTHGTITLSGDVSGSAKIGSGETAVNIEVTVADDSHKHNDYLLNTTDTLEGDLTVTGTVEMGDLTLRKDEYVFADASGNTVATIDAVGVSSTEFTATKSGTTHKLTEKANQSDVDAQISGVISTLESEVAEIERTIADNEKVTSEAVNELSGKLTSHEGVSGTTSLLGHVRLQSGDFSGVTSAVNGVAASPYHNHSQYLQTSGGTINGNLDVNGTVEMNDLTLNKDEYEFADASGNTIVKITKDGMVDSVDYITKGGEHKLTEKANQSDLESAVEELKKYTDGYVTGPTSATASNIAIFDGATGKAIKDGGKKITDLAPTSHASSDTTYGSGTTSQYGHVKLTSGDCSTSLTQGIAAASKHSHGDYVNKSGDTITGNLTINADLEAENIILKQNEYVFADASGNIIAKINASGIVETTDVILSGSTKLSDKVETSGTTTTVGNVVVYAGTDGKKIKDSGFTIKTSVPENAVFTDSATTVEGHYSPTATTNSTSDKTPITRSIKKGEFTPDLTIPSLKYDSKGHITSVSTTRYEFPDDPLAYSSDITNIQTIIADNEEVVAAALADIDDKKLNVSGGTITGNLTVNGTVEMGDMVLNKDEFIFADGENIIARINDKGVSSTDFTTKDGKKLSECITSAEIAGLGGGDVVGPSSSISGNVVTFSDTTGKVIKDSGFTIKTSVPENAVFTDTKVKSISTTALTYYLLGHALKANGTIDTAYKSSHVYVTEGSKVCASNGFFQTSDANLKNFHGDIPLDFERLREIPKVYYSWKDDEKQTKHIGTSAQEVQKVYPELVSIGVNNELSVDYPKFTMVALKAVDVLYEENQTLKQELEQMKTDMAAIKMKIGL